MDNQPEQPANQEQGITADALASNQSPQLPDQSILGNQLDAIIGTDPISQRREQEATYAQLQQEVAELKNQMGYNRPEYDALSDKIKDADDGQSQMMKQLQAELEQIRMGKDELAQRLEQQQLDQQINQFTRDVTAWVRTNQEHFPLVNTLGEPGLVAQKMLEHRQLTGQTISEARAAREVEQQLTAVVDRLAPKLGYTKGEVRSDSDDDSISINSTMQATEPVDTSNMTREQKIAYLVQKHAR